LSFSYITFSDLASDNWDKYPIHRYLAQPLSNEAVCLRYDGYSRYTSMVSNSLRKSINALWSRERGPTAAEYFAAIKQKDSLKGYDARPLVVFTDSLYNADKIKYEGFLEDNFSTKRKDKLFELITSLEKQGIHVILLESPAFKIRNFFNDPYIADYERFRIEL